MKTVNFGIIGPGGIAQKFANACKSIPDVQVVAVASNNLSRATTFADSYGIETIYGSYSELVEDSNIDAVYISVINSMHWDAIELVAKSGKAILCEKPCVVNQYQADKLQKLLAETNILFMEAMWTLHLPAIQKAKEWVDTNRIGQLKAIESTFSFLGKKAPGARIFTKELWGGGLLDVGVYCIAFSNYIAGGAPTEVKAVEYIGDTEVDEYGTVLMRYPNDVISTGHYGILLYRPNTGYIHGLNGHIETDNFWDCQEMRLYDIADNLIETYTSKHDNGFVYEISHFADLFRSDKKESNINTLQNSMDYINIFEQIRAQR